MLRICAVRQDRVSLEIRQVTGKVREFYQTPFQSVRLTHSSRDHKRDPYLSGRTRPSPRSRRFTDEGEITRSAAGYTRKTQFAIPSNAGPGLSSPFSRPCNNRLAAILGSFDASCAPYCEVMEYGVTNGGVTSSITYWDAIIPTEINPRGRVVARSKEHRRHFVAVCLP